MCTTAHYESFQLNNIIIIDINLFTQGIAAQFL